MEASGCYYFRPLPSRNAATEITSAPVCANLQLFNCRQAYPPSTSFKNWIIIAIYQDSS